MANEVDVRGVAAFPPDTNVYKISGTTTTGSYTVNISAGMSGVNGHPLYTSLFCEGAGIDTGYILNVQSRSGDTGVVTWSQPITAGGSFSNVKCQPQFEQNGAGWDFSMVYADVGVDSAGILRSVSGRLALPIRTSSPGSGSGSGTQNIISAPNRDGRQPERRRLRDHQSVVRS